MEKTTQEICYALTGIVFLTTINSPTMSVLYETNTTIPNTNSKSYISSYINPEDSLKSYIEKSDFYNEMIKNAIHRYQLVNKTEYKMMNQCSDFLIMLFNLFPFAEPQLSFRNDSVKAIIKTNGKSFSLKQDFDYPESLFVSTFIGTSGNEVLNVFEAKINDYNSVRKFIDA